MPVAGVTDGGEIASIKYTAQLFNSDIEERYCLCHMLNLVIKKFIEDYFADSYLIQIRSFISQINYSNPFNISWNDACIATFKKKVRIICVLAMTYN